jgi:hypothetical protein
MIMLAQGRQQPQNMNSRGKSAFLEFTSPFENMRLIMDWVRRGLVGERIGVK